MHLDVWCCNSHGDLAKILEKTCHARSPCKENFRNWKHFLPLVGMYLHKELIIAMKVIIIFKEDFTEFCNANYILTVYPQSQLTTPENTMTYHNALCLSPQNFA